jgi:hypothetical protein
MRAWPAALLLLAPLLSGCLGGGGASDLILVANAPSVANGMSLALVAPRGLFGPAEGSAVYWVHHDGRVVYPGAGGAPLPLVQGRATDFVPYSRFVVENGDYQVVVDLEGRRAQTTVSVTKWVSWLYVVPYFRNDTIVADVVLEMSSGEPNARVFAAGQLNFQVRYRGEDGEVDELRLSRAVRTDGLDSFERLVIPLQDLAQGDRNRGYYAINATFHNDQANGNNNVLMDPALAQPDPPMNWVYLPLTDRCPMVVQPPPPLPCVGS